MSYQFKAGDHIRVSRISGSSWQEWHGTVVDVVVRGEDEHLQECAVNLAGEQRWFMAEHLTRTVPPQWVRFFRNEAADRWKLDPDSSASLDGDWDQLIELLCGRYDFTIRRAQSEADQFYKDFDRKTQQAPAAARASQHHTGFAGASTAA